MHHSFRGNANEIKRDKVDRSRPSKCLSSEQTLQHVSQLPTIIENAEFVVEGFGERHNWTKKSIFWELPYWKTNLLRNNLNVVNIEKNFFGNIFNTVMNCEVLECVTCEPFPFISLGFIICPDVVRLLFPSLL